MNKYDIGVDVGGTKTAYAVLDSDRKIIARRKRPSDPSLSAEQFFDLVALNVDELLIESGLNKTQINGVGVGVPSYVTYGQGYIEKTVNLVNLQAFPARDYLSAKLALPVALDNDAHAAALAEHRFGAGRGFPHMLFCPLSTGCSSAIIYDGKLMRGSYGWAGESGHMIVTPGEGIVCGCGNKGCIMSYVSGGMIIKHIVNWISSGESTLMTSLAGDAALINAYHINEAYELGDKMAVRAVSQMASYMAIWLYNLYVTLNINCFVFGGGLLSLGPKLIKPMREMFDEYNKSDKPVYMKLAELGDDMGLIGASLLLTEF